jgi:hypothetical protein
MAKEVIGFCDMHKVCRFCGEEFHYNSYQFGTGLKALEEKKEHESVCPVRFGREECPKEWKETLERAREKIENCQGIIDYLTEDLHSMHYLLREKAKEIIEQKKRAITDFQKSIGEPYWDYEYENLMTEDLERELIESLKREFQEE